MIEVPREHPPSLESTSGCALGQPGSYLQESICRQSGPILKDQPPKSFRFRVQISSLIYESVGTRLSRPWFARQAEHIGAEILSQSHFRVCESIGREANHRFGKRSGLDALMGFVPRHHVHECAAQSTAQVELSR